MDFNWDRLGLGFLGWSLNWARIRIVIRSVLLGLRDLLPKVANHIRQPVEDARANGRLAQGLNLLADRQLITRQVV